MHEVQISCAEDFTVNILEKNVGSVHGTCVFEIYVLAK